MDVPDENVERILRSLGFGVESAFAPPIDSAGATAGPGGWKVICPPWRIDIHRQVDLIEEVGHAEYPDFRQTENLVRLRVMLNTLARLDQSPLRFVDPALVHARPLFLGCDANDEPL